MDFRPVELKDKEIITKYLRMERQEICDACFGNIFLWQCCFDTKWTIEENMLLIQAEDDELYIMPPYGSDYSRLPELLDKIKDYLEERGQKFSMFGATPEFIQRLEEIRPGKYRYEKLEDKCDYIYNQADLATLAGRKYHKKRNHLNAFLKDNPNYEYRPLTEEYKEGCLELAEKWRTTKDMSDDSFFACERDVILRGLRYFEELDFKGGVILLDGKVQAFSFGEVLNEDTAVVHIEKSAADIRGLYVAINHEYVKNAWSDMKYINREEDLGLEGLRHAKNSYYPVKMSEKYVIYLKDE